jgi:hypothetical protein
MHGMPQEKVRVLQERVPAWEHYRPVLPAMLGSGGAAEVRGEETGWVCGVWGGEMSKFKVGDRVRIFGSTWHMGIAHGTAASVKSGKVFDVNTGGEHIAIHLDSGLDVSAHPKQCRRLVPKKRREWWLYESEHGYLMAENDENMARYFAKSKPVIHVREIKP